MLRRRWSTILVFVGIWILATIYFLGLTGTPTTQKNVNRQSVAESFGKADENHYEKLKEKHHDFGDKEEKKVIEHDFEETADEQKGGEIKEDGESGDEKRQSGNLARPIVPNIRSDNDLPEVDLDILGQVNNDEEQSKKDEIFKKYQFNGWLSDKIGYRRKIPDSRHKLCPLQYQASLPKASIIVCFFNESPSVLIRMVNSILDRTPLELIQEIILIDDSSEWEDAYNEALEYKARHPLWNGVKFLKTPKNYGLIRAKVFGARKARGEVLVFLDSHCEVNTDWLQPLLERIQGDKKRVVCPIIDIIDSDTLKYVESPVCKGGMNWGLTFKWDYPSRSYFQDKVNYIKPLQSSTMAGGLFAVDREYFFHIGSYDEGMDIWGAENVEISIRIWTCGGSLEILPCSRVGHIFRRQRPYGTDRDTMGKNALRTAKVWLDEYLENFYSARPYLRLMTDYYLGNMTDRIELRKRLQCKPFKWFLDHIYPELLPGNTPEEFQISHKVSASKKYLIRLTNTSLCMSADGVSGRLTRGSAVEMKQCNDEDRVQQWRYTETMELRPMGSARLCLDSLKGVSLLKCHNQGAHQEWKFTTDGRIFNPSTGKCISSYSERSSHAFLEYCGKTANYHLLPLT